MHYFLKLNIYNTNLLIQFQIIEHSENRQNQVRHNKSTQTTGSFTIFVSLVDFGPSTKRSERAKVAVNEGRKVNNTNRQSKGREMGTGSLWHPAAPRMAMHHTR